MNGNSSTSPEEASATGRPDSDPLATHDDPAKFLTQDILQPTSPLVYQTPFNTTNQHNRPTTLTGLFKSPPEPCGPDDRGDG